MFFVMTLLGASAADRASTSIPKPRLGRSNCHDQGRAGGGCGGCFWGIQAVFQHVKGVVGATSGYSRGSAKTAEYELVSTGETGHAESVKITYDPSQITYGQLLRVLFSVA